MTPLPTLSFHSEDINCEHCRSAITSALEQLVGVESIQVDLDSKRVTVRGLALSADAILEALDRAGYRALPA